MFTFKHMCASRRSSAGIWKSHFNLWLWANYKFFSQKRWQVKRRKRYSVFNELSTLVLLFSELSTDQSKDIQNKQNKTNKNTVKLHHTDYLSCRKHSDRVQALYLYKLGLNPSWKTGLPRRDWNSELSNENNPINSTGLFAAEMRNCMLYSQFCKTTKSKKKTIMT